MIGARLGHVIFYQTELFRGFFNYFFLLNLVAELNLLDLEGWRVMEPQLNHHFDVYIYKKILKNLFSGF